MNLAYWWGIGYEDENLMKGPAGCYEPEYRHNLEEETEMKLNITAAAAFIVGALSLFAAGISSATEHKHVADAITHAQAAVNDGQRGTADAVAGHAQQALEHAKQADNAQPDTHITEAETHLHQAIDHATMGHADIAANHAQEAMRHLKMAYIHVYKRT